MKIVFDTEVTGFNFKEDEILQLSIIDGDGNVLLDELYRPRNKTNWEDAAKINGITPDMVQDKPTIMEDSDKIQNIFNAADEIIAYNATFDLGVLAEIGIVVQQDKVIDVMIDFAQYYGEWSEKYQQYRWKKLSYAAAYFGYDFNAHDSLEDVKATLVVYYALKSRVPPFNWFSYQVISANDVIFESDNIADVCRVARELYGKEKIRDYIVQISNPYYTFEQCMTMWRK